MNTQFDYQPGLQDYLKTSLHGLALIMLISTFPSSLKNIQTQTLTDFILTQDISSSPSRVALDVIKQYPQKAEEKSLINNDKYIYAKLEVDSPTQPVLKNSRTIGSVVDKEFIKTSKLPTYQDMLSGLTEKERMRVLNSNFSAGDYQEMNKEQVELDKKIIEKTSSTRYGHLILNNGLALTDKHNIQVRHIVNGKPVAVGIFDPKTADYKIETTQPGGYIEASLYDENGEVLGRGFYTGTENNNSIQLKQETRRKRTNKTTARTVDPYTGKPIKSRMQSLNNSFDPSDKEGSYSDTAIQAESTYTTMFASKNFVNTSAIMIAGQENNIVMVSDSYLNSYLEFMKEKNLLLETQNFYFSKVSQDNKALAGITVHIEQNEATAARVVYFNEFYLPDFERQNTSTNGEFSIINLSPGAHVLSFKRGEQIIGFRNIYIGESAAVRENIDFSQFTHPATVYYYDAITGEPLDGNLSLQGLAEQVEILGGQKSIILNDYNHTGYAFAEEDDSFVANYFLYNQSDREFYFPRIQKRWLNEAKTALKISDDPFGKTVVGFVESEEDFDVYVPENRDNHLQIQFFDKTGRFLETSEGSAGGGFVIFGADEGSLNVVVIPKNIEEISSRFTLLDPGVTSVLRYKF